MFLDKDAVSKKLLRLSQSIRSPKQNWVGLWICTTTIHQWKYYDSQIKKKQASLQDEGWGVWRDYSQLLQEGNESVYFGVAIFPLSAFMSYFQSWAPTALTKGSIQRKRKRTCFSFFIGNESVWVIMIWFLIKQECVKNLRIFLVSEQTMSGTATFCFFSMFLFDGLLFCLKKKRTNAFSLIPAQLNCPNTTQAFSLSTVRTPAWDSCQCKLK